MKIHQMATLAVALIIAGCGSQESVIETAVPAPAIETRSLFVSEKSSSAEQYIRNYLLNEYTQLHSLPAVMEDAVMADAAPSDSTLSSTNRIEKNVDEADLIKAFTYQSQDYLVTVSEPQYTFSDLDFAVAADLAYPEPLKSEPAKLNLYAINDPFRRFNHAL